ncbi:unnamed protein product [Moneuplotes crassus]|uniref:Uncharacterized protein n=1 Tax=Euplotes crassus TaxID=5936 RepID=A0AAD1Y3J1_EUPCR|nr:unnamed protein product [Moneuplotes crassus]
MCWYFREFKTTIGRTVSLMIKIVLILYAYIMLRIMMGRKNTSKIVNTVIKDILNDASPISLQGTNF